MSSTNVETFSTLEWGRVNPQRIPHISVPAPGPKSKHWHDRCTKHFKGLSAQVKLFPVSFESGAGCVLRDVDGNEYIDFSAGTYNTPWGYAVRVTPADAARHATKGFLAGSALTMDRGMANLLQWLKLPAEQIWAMGTLNPARLLGLEAKGLLQAGADADLVLWDHELRAVYTWVSGVCTYARP